MAQPSSAKILNSSFLHTSDTASPPTPSFLDSARGTLAIIYRRAYCLTQLVLTRSTDSRLQTKVDAVATCRLPLQNSFGGFKCHQTDLRATWPELDVSIKASTFHCVLNLTASCPHLLQRTHCKQRFSLFSVWLPQGHSTVRVSPFQISQTGYLYKMDLGSLHSYDLHSTASLVCLCHQRYIHNKFIMQYRLALLCQL